MSSYVAIPFEPTPERAGVVSALMRGIASKETVFTDYTAGEERLETVARTLSAPGARVWEVWGENGLAGVLYLTDIRPGLDATAHYVFFDGRLADKTELLEGVIAWCFEDHPELHWQALRRLSIQIPDFAFALARHATEKLGFGGEFEYTRAGNSRAIAVEGVRKGAILWRGQPRDLLLLRRDGGA